MRRARRAERARKAAENITGIITEGLQEAAAAELPDRYRKAEGCGCGTCGSYAHASDCAVHYGPALPVGPCDCRGVWQRVRSWFGRR